MLYVLGSIIFLVVYRIFRHSQTRCPSCGSTQYRKIHNYAGAELLVCTKCKTKFYDT